MSNFNAISGGDDLKEVIKAAFDMDIDVCGEWGYTKEEATIINTPQEHPISQVEHTLASMRAYIEMNMTLEKENRYGSINLSEKSREEDGAFHKVEYEISAMKEDVYADFIQEYKDGHATESFDIGDHFKRRKEATLIRNVTHWFKIV